MIKITREEFCDVCDKLIRKEYSCWRTIGSEDDQGGFNYDDFLMCRDCAISFNLWKKDRYSRRMKNVCSNNESCEGADQGAHQHAEEDG